MPELPEVETIRQDLNKVIVGKKNTKATILWAKTVAPLSPTDFQKKISDTKITDIERRAKMIRIKLTGPLDLLVHLKMTGQLIFQPKTGKIISGGHPQPGGLDNLPNKFTRLIFDFSDGSKLFFNDMRKFGWVKLLDDATVAKLFAEHGPEPLTKDFSLKYFQSLLSTYPRRPIKQILLDQKLIAGIGNIYADESCFIAKILPTRLAGKITGPESKKLHQAIIAVLKHSISKHGTSSRNYVRSDGSQGGFVPHLQVYGRAGQPCKVCKRPIQKIRLLGRGTQYCANCQK
ncbi:MAG: bifunctional DNA-formamidopyrimidine glycosylase/DNA-(apurinic or apyrimidinic site) lyase [Candidatus Paceibacterota bacterium]